MKYTFPDTTLLITHYNRSESLDRLLTTFDKLDCTFGAIIISDDGSRPEHLRRIGVLKTRYPIQLTTADVNKGLGNNINKGQDIVKTPFTLYVQEDFEPSEIFPAHFEDALNFMREDPKWDIVRFYAYFKYPNLKPYKKGFSEMVYSFWDMNHLKFYYYSDHPHLRRSDFLKKFGRYPEGIKGDLTEYRMAIHFLQRKGKGLFFDDFTKLFYQKNSSDEPSTMERPDWRLSKNPLIQLSRLVYLRYRWLKNTLDLLIMN
ncbi:glycosyltransferase [Dyadobacter sp. CY345]|uniref:glycosyltransferase n=1 Tax=Dyadobacter sp. CY345 TaxID=2909335 RepID=UPI001F250F41|nr:glycosyltransferase [Dyadobacter sp. CY345]MCF2444150.1 glycosyltransferase [Dyadobacter sp. CY345]